MNKFKRLTFVGMLLFAGLFIECSFSAGGDTPVSGWMREKRPNRLRFPAAACDLTREMARGARVCV